MSKSIKVILAIFVLGCIFAMGTYLFFSLNGSPFEKQKLREEVETYLLTHYNERIDILKVDYSYTSNMYFADVITVDEPKITFRVSKNNDGAFVDSYFISYWDYCISNDISNYALDIFNTFCEGDVLFTEGSPISYDDYLSLGRVPDFLTVRDEFKAKIFSFVKINNSFHIENKEEEFNNIYMVSKYIFDKYQFDSVEFVYSNNTNVTLSLNDYNNLKEVKEIENYIK